MVCPGPDLGKDPAQTIELLRRLHELIALGRPVLLAVSRKDFVGALLGRRRGGGSPARWQRSRTAWSAARTSCASTTSRRRATF